MTNLTNRAHIPTARMVLSPLAAADAAVPVAALSDYEVARRLTVVPFAYTLADFEEFLPRTRPGEHWAICDGAGLAGVIGLDDHFGYWLAMRVGGQGCMTESGCAVLAAYFADPAAGPVVSGYFVSNARSAALLGKLGFVETGRGRKANRAQGCDLAHVELRLTCDGFLTAQIAP